MEWISIKEKLPNKNTQYLAYKRYDWERNGNKGSFYQTQILVFNSYHECWDDESGDDYDCGIYQVAFWMELPNPPKK